MMENIFDDGKYLRWWKISSMMENIFDDGKYLRWWKISSMISTVYLCAIAYLLSCLFIWMTALSLNCLVEPKEFNQLPLLYSIIFLYPSSRPVPSKEEYPSLIHTTTFFILLCQNQVTYGNYGLIKIIGVPVLILSTNKLWNHTSITFFLAFKMGGQAPQFQLVRFFLILVFT